jgi:6-phosphofructokinase 1
VLRRGVRKDPLDDTGGLERPERLVVQADPARVFDQFLAGVGDGRDWPAQLVGLRGNEVVSSPLMECVTRTKAVAERIAARDLEGAMLLRGGSFQEFHSILSTIQRAAPRPTRAGRQRFRIAVVHGGGPAPGMNTAVRAAVRLGLDRGYSVPWTA